MRLPAVAREGTRAANTSKISPRELVAASSMVLVKAAIQGKKSRDSASALAAPLRSFKMFQVLSSPRAPSPARPRIGPRLRQCRHLAILKTCRCYEEQSSRYPSAEDQPHELC